MLESDDKLLESSLTPRGSQVADRGSVLEEHGGGLGGVEYANAVFGQEIAHSPQTRGLTAAGAAGDDHFGNVHGARQLEATMTRREG